MSTPRDNLKGLEDKDRQNITMQNIEPKGHNETTIDSSINKHLNAITDGPSGSSQPQTPQVEVGGPRRNKRIDGIEKKALEKATSSGNPAPAAPATRRKKTIPKAKSQLEAGPAAPKARLILPPPQIQPQPEAQPDAPKARLIMPPPPPQPKAQLEAQPALPKARLIMPPPQPEALPTLPKARLIMPPPPPPPQFRAQLEVQPVAAPKARLIMPPPPSQHKAQLEAQPAAPKARLIMPAPIPSSAAAPKARLIMPPPQPEALPVAPKALPKPKGVTRKSTVKPTGTVRRTRKVVAPAYEAPAHETPAASTNKTNIPDARLLQVQKMVDNFQDGLTRLREALSNLAELPAHAPSGSISRETVIGGFRAGMAGLEGGFPALVNEMNGLADAIMLSPQEPGREETDAGDAQGDKRKGARKPAKKTLTKSLNKKRPRLEDDNEEEDAGRHHPRPRLTPMEPQGAFGQAEVSTSLGGKRRRGEEDDVDDESDGRRPRKVAKGKGKEALTTVILPEYTSMVLPPNSPPDASIHMHPLDLLATVALQQAAGPSSSRMVSMGKR